MGSVMDQDRDGLFVHVGPPPEHPDNVAVNCFADAMKAKLRVARRKGRGGWDRKDECSAEDLSRMLRDHVDKGYPVDVANFCMMLHQRGERITMDVTGIIDPADAEFLGEKIIEMTDRLKPMHAVMPGAQATYAFEENGVVYRLAMTIEPSGK